MKLHHRDLTLASLQNGRLCQSTAGFAGCLTILVADSTYLQHGATLDCCEVACQSSCLLGRCFVRADGKPGIVDRQRFGILRLWDYYSRINKDYDAGSRHRFNSGTQIASTHCFAQKKPTTLIDCHQAVKRANQLPHRASQSPVVSVRPHVTIHRPRSTNENSNEITQFRTNPPQR